MAPFASSRSSKSTDDNQELQYDATDSLLVVTRVAESEKPVDPREKLSPYFSIAAAGFGMISDGCLSPMFLSLSMADITT